MPAYAKDGRVVCFFQGREKFKTRYATSGFQHEANLDEGNRWPTAFALKKVTAAKRGKDRGAREESGELRRTRPLRPGFCTKVRGVFTFYTHDAVSTFF